MNLNCTKCGKRPGDRVYCDNWECPELDWDIIANVPRQAPEPAVAEVDLYRRVERPSPYQTGDCRCGYGWNCKETGCRKPKPRDPNACSDADA